jgi:hypothetical protein
MFRFYAACYSAQTNGFGGYDPFWPLNTGVFISANYGQNFQLDPAEKVRIRILIPNTSFNCRVRLLNHLILFVLTTFALVLLSCLPVCRFFVTSISRSLIWRHVNNTLIVSSCSMIWFSDFVSLFNICYDVLFQGWYYGQNSGSC